jgi:hypothetical protein
VSRFEGLLGGHTAPAVPILDIDAADRDQPNNVVEYIKDIYEHLRQFEVKYKPSANYMASQTDITDRMRAILVDWLIDVHLKFKLMPETIDEVNRKLDQMAPRMDGFTPDDRSEYDRLLARKREDVGLVKHLGHEAHALVHVDAVAAVARNARGLLAAVVQRVQREKHDAAGVLVAHGGGAVHAARMLHALGAAPEAIKNISHKLHTPEGIKEAARSEERRVGKECE